MSTPKITVELKRQRREMVRDMVFATASPTAKAVIWQPPQVTLLSDAEIYNLPTPHAQLTGSGVYFLWRGTDLLYIGSSENVFSRVSSHINTGESEFTAATFLSVPSPWHLAIEALYIREFKPRLNRQFLSRT